MVNAPRFDQFGGIFIFFSDRDDPMALPHKMQQDMHPEIIQRPAGIGDKSNGILVV
jgi:hypothetical protein